jgi:hypothetical protein
LSHVITQTDTIDEFRSSILDALQWSDVGLRQYSQNKVTIVQPTDLGRNS